MSVTECATARAFANIAFIKYWGNTDQSLRLPANPSLSMNLEGLYAQTTVTWGVATDSLLINGQKAGPAATARVGKHLQELRNRFGIQHHAQVESVTNIPLGAGIASSAAAFAALTVAALAAAGLHCDEATLSALARLGSGSAARSIPTGFVAWPKSDAHESGFARSIAPPEHWPLADVIAIINPDEKAVSSNRGHLSAMSSPLQAARVQSADERFAICEQAILERDFEGLAAVVETDSNAMHAVMMTSQPPLLYWQPASLTVMQSVLKWRASGIPICYTLDAGPNVHCLCPEEFAPEIRTNLRELPGVLDVRQAKVGRGAEIIHESS